MNGSSSSAASMTVETKQATASATNENQLAGVKRIGELDVTKAERKVWLVKIPELLASSWGFRDKQGVDHLGELEVTKDPSGKKSYTIHVDKSQFSSETAQVTPQNFKINFGPPQGHRVLKLSEKGGGLMEGVVTKHGIAVPDAKDPCYRAYCQANKRRRQEERRAKPTTKVIRDREIPESFRQENIRGVSKEIFESRKEESKVQPRQNASILSLFEEAPTWSRRDMLAALKLNHSENDVREGITKYCQYIASGPNRGTYMLKPEYRTSRTKKLDEDPPDE